MTQLARKVVIIGAGNVGSHVAMNLMVGQYADEIVFLDINEATANAQVEDLKDMLTATRRHVHIRVGTYDDCADASFIVMTAGRSRRPGETRLQMLSSTFSILGSIVEPIAKSGFSGFLICVSNPADVVAEYFYRKLDLPRARVFSTGTSLDTVRLRRHIASIVDVDRDQVEAFCMGEHGDSSFIPRTHVSIGGIGIEEYLRSHPQLADRLDYATLTDTVHTSGGRIVAGKGSTEFGIGSVVAVLIARREGRVRWRAVHPRAQRHPGDPPARTLAGREGRHALLLQRHPRGVRKHRVALARTQARRPRRPRRPQRPQRQTNRATF